MSKQLRYIHTVVMRRSPVCHLSGFVVFIFGWFAALALSGLSASAQQSTPLPQQTAPLPQQTAPLPPQITPPAPPPSSPVPQPTVAPSSLPAQYRLGTDDAIAVAVRQAPELNTSTRVGADGNVTLPLIGTLSAAKLTIAELEAAIEEKLRARYIREPEVVVTVTELRSRGVTVVGAVQKPGVHQIAASTSLLEVLSMAGGISPEAGEEILVQRQASADAAAQSFRIKLSALLAADAAANIPLQPGDLVNVQPTGMVYVMGAVKKPGAYPIRGNAGLTVLRALSYGEGLTVIAAQHDAVVLRMTADGQRLEIPVDLARVLQGRTPDVPLESHDVLFVPISGGKAATKVTLDFVARLLGRGLLPF